MILKFTGLPKEKMVTSQCVSIINNIFLFHIIDDRPRDGFNKVSTLLYDFKNYLCGHRHLNRK